MPTDNSKGQKDLNPVLYVYRGFPIRKYNRLNIRVNQNIMRKVIDGKVDKGLSAMEVIKQEKIFCDVKSA